MTHQSECVKPTNCPTFDSLADTIIVGIPEGQDGNVTKHPNSAPDENIAEAKVCPRNNPNSFAETEAELVTHTCVTAQTRMKKALPDFYNLYAEKTATKYSDPDFLPDQDSIFWAVMNEGILSWADMDEGILRGIDWE